MKMTKNTNFFIGLDIGTNSVGWAVSDENYNVIKKNGKLLAGSRLFEDAKTAEERRKFRSSRRRMGRRKFRIELLQELFDKEVSKKDGSFFMRLKESSLWPADKTCNGKYSLFNDKSFTDREFYRGRKDTGFKGFPTVYHLREYLLNNEVDDIRFVYLACHHIVKYRGHFLYPPEFEVGKLRTREILEKINDKLNEIEQSEELCLDVLKSEEIDRLIADTNKKETEKKTELKKLLFGETNKPRQNKLFEAMIGNKIDLATIFDDKEKFVEFNSEEKELVKELKFSSDKFDDAFARLQESFDIEAEFIGILKEFYSAYKLNKVLKGEKYFCSAMTKIYEEHNKDLKALKKFIKLNYGLNTYNKMFRYFNVRNNYPSYIGSNISYSVNNGKKNVAHCEIVLNKTKSKMEQFARCTQESFLEHLKEVLETKKDELENNENEKIREEYKYFIDKINNGELLARLNTSTQALVPYQLNEIELRAILNKQSKFNLDADKIIKLLTFRIPYYVGPLNNSNDEFAWVVKNSGFEKCRITPWNYKDAVNESASGERFIKKMTNKCTYLKACDVLPKQSLLYQQYMVLQDLNNLRINGNKIPQKLKQSLFDDFMQKTNATSKKEIKAWLVAQSAMKQDDKLGKEDENDQNFNSSLSSLNKFKNILGEEAIEKYQLFDLCEKVIYWHTLFPNEKKMVEEKIKQNYKERLYEIYKEKAEEIINSLAGKLSFSGWARLSKEFLTEIKVIKKTGGDFANEPVCIMDVLKSEVTNLQEILNSNNYTPSFFEECTKQNRSRGEEKINYEYLEDLYCSPSVKRAIWQTNLIIDEIIKIMGGLPAKVFIEVTRGEDKTKQGKMTDSRKKHLMDLYSKAKSDIIDLAKMRNELNRMSKEEDRKLRGDRLYFYYLQGGKCAYTGKQIDLAKLQTNLYDIDHIYPQSKIKDDSLTNRVLVLKEYNEGTKKDIYPLPPEIQTKMKATWESWNKNGLCSDEKLARLQRKDPLTDDEMTAFINRQLVSTAQGAKEVADLLKIKFSNGEKVEIGYSKARNVSEFRQKFGISKCREINNLHHAKDAYLNIVVGNVWDEEYGDLRTGKAVKKSGGIFNEDRAVNKLFERDVKKAWKTGSNGSIVTVKKFAFENKYIVTARPYEEGGQMFKETRHKKENKPDSNLIKLKETKKENGTDLFDVSKYGGYTARFGAYFVLCESDGKKGKRKLTVEQMPIMYAVREKYKNNLENKKALMEELYGLKNVKIIVPKILFGSLFEIGGIRCRIGGVTGPSLIFYPDYEWFVDNEQTAYCHDIFKQLKIGGENKKTKDKNAANDDAAAEEIVISMSERSDRKQTIDKERNLKLYKQIIAQLEKPFYAKYAFAKNKLNDENIKQQFEDKFAEVSVYKQLEILKNLLNFITKNGAYADLRDLGGSKNETCKVIIGKDITNFKVNLINQSVTGFFENKLILSKGEQIGGI